MPGQVVVIIGRPNVGKSTLFNRITGGSAAIVEDLPGVTRDRNYMDAEWAGKPFTIVDTGGFFPHHEDDIYAQMREQAMFAIEEADVIIHLLDAKEGLNPYDKDIAGVLRSSGKKVVWAVNKVDSDKKEDMLYEFHALGAADLLPVSARTGRNFDELMDKVASFIAPAPPLEAEYPRVAVVGRPNVGKSTLVNTLLGKRRMLVSPTAGTTRDSVDTVCSYYRRKYLLIDTAGIRRKSMRGYSLERFAVVRALKSIERSDVAALLMDASEGIVADDVKIAGLVHFNYKGAVLVFNKWDLVGDPEAAYRRLTAQVRDRLWFFYHAPVLTVSAVEKKRATKILPLVDGVLAERKKRVATGELNRFAAAIGIPPYRGRQVRVLYMTQVGVEPPSFALFTNVPEGITQARVRQIESMIRERFSFAGTPMRIFVRKRS